MDGKSTKRVFLDPAEQHFDLCNEACSSVCPASGLSSVAKNMEHYLKTFLYDFFVYTFHPYVYHIDLCNELCL